MSGGGRAINLRRSVDCEAEHAQQRLGRVHLEAHPGQRSFGVLSVGGYGEEDGWGCAAATILTSKIGQRFDQPRAGQIEGEK